jgi:hypothetical protein
MKKIIYTAMCLFTVLLEVRAHAQGPLPHCFSVASRAAITAARRDYPNAALQEINFLGNDDIISTFEASFETDAKPEIMSYRLTLRASDCSLETVTREPSVSVEKTELSFDRQEPQEWCCLHGNVCNPGGPVSCRWVKQGQCVVHPHICH